MEPTKVILSNAVARALTEIGIGDDIDATVEPSARPEFGDWSTPSPLRGARVLRQSPMAIAEKLKTALEQQPLDIVQSWSISPPGYVNARLADSVWAHSVVERAMTLDPSHPINIEWAHRRTFRKTLIEHTNINTNKAAHIGHLRNACIGDTVARILRRVGDAVEVNNYIDDTGVQVADVIVGLRELRLQPKEGEPYDHFCSRVYVDVCKRYEGNPELVGKRQEVLHAIEARDNEVAQFAKNLAKKIVRAHLLTMSQFSVTYDLLTWESDILELGFWKTAFSMLKDGGVIVHVDKGKNANCWVLPSTDDPNDDEAKVLVKSNGIATYTAKDIAYQLWKFGLLGKDFQYAHFDDGDIVTTASGNGDAALTGFGRADRVINVIDARQAYPQQVVQVALRRMGFTDEAEQSIHLAYEVVALSAATAQQLGFDVEADKQLVAFSGRKGIEVRADDVLKVAADKLRDKARDDASAHLLAAGAIRYYLLKFSLQQIIAFDFDEALRTIGDTGVYLQYAHARSAGILRKVDADNGALVIPQELLPAERTLLHRIDLYDDALADAALTLSPSILTAYAFSLASALSDFYEHTPPMIREENVDNRRFRRTLVEVTKKTLGDALTTLGMAAPDHV